MFNIKVLKGEKILKLSLLQNNNFCVYCQNNSFIFEFDKENFAINEIGQVNVNLKSLIETKEHKYINYTDNMIYLWKNGIKNIFHKDIPSFLLFLIIFIFEFIIIKFTPSYISGFEIDGFKLKCITYKKLILENFIFITIFGILYYKYYYLLNPYKRIKHKYIQRLERIGNRDLYIAYTFYDISLFNIKTYEMEKIFSQEGMEYIIINQDIILFLNISNNTYLVYDVDIKQVINQFTEQNMNKLFQKLKLEENLYITKVNNVLFKWKFDFESKTIIILKRKLYDNLHMRDLMMNIIDDKLYLLTGILIDQFNSEMYLNVYN